MSAEVTNRLVLLGVVIGGGLLGALFLGRAVAHEDFTKIALVLSFIFATLLVLSLGRRYWYAIPVTVGLNLPTFQLGARNIDLSELAVAGCALVFALRFALKEEKLILFKFRYTPIYLYFLWVMFVWLLYPVGLAGFGSEIGGGRFYATILLAMASFLVVANQEITEADVRWIFWLLIAGSFLNLGRAILEYAVLGRTLGVVQMDLDTEGHYTWHQELAGPASIFALILLSRFPLREILSIFHLGRALAFFACLAPILYSGKRAAVGVFLFYPVIVAFIRKEFHYLWIFLGLAVLGLSFLLAGQGEIFHLPLNVQRALSWLPAKWDPEMEQFSGGADAFRKALREIAWEEIQADPLIGDGFRVDINEAAAAYYSWLNFGSMGEIRNQVMPYAIGKAWHNTWLGYAADFGIPLSIIQAFVLIVGLRIAFLSFRQASPGSWLQAASLYCFLFFCRDVLLSWTSGHSATDTLSRWWMYAFIFAIYETCQKQGQQLKRFQPKLVTSLSKTSPNAAAPQAAH